MKAWIVLMRLGAMTGCHQMRTRSLFFRGYQLPLCARCTGLLTGHCTALIFFIANIKFEFINNNLFTLVIPAIISLALLGIDGIGQLKGVWTSTNFRRLLTGLLCGIFVTLLFVKAVLFIPTLL